jgi:hypothetical protein
MPYSCHDLISLISCLYSLILEKQPETLNFEPRNGDSQPNGLSPNGLAKGLSLPFVPSAMGIMPGLAGGLSSIREIAGSSFTLTTTGFIYRFLFVILSCPD